jgi:uncharacterized membrane protein
MMRPSSRGAETRSTPRSADCPRMPVDLLQIALRLIHIFAGILWVGGAFYFFIFIEPTSTELGPDSEKFMTRIIVGRRMPLFFLALSGLTVLAGLILYWIDSSGLQASWISQPRGLGLTVGAVAALIAFIGGNALIKPNVDKLAAIGAEIKAGGGPPTEAQQRALLDVQHALRRIGTIDIVLLAIAVVGMVSAQNLG